MIIVRPIRVRAAIAAALLLAGAVAAFADTPPPPNGQPSKETREKMAVLHEQLAACLRSDKPLSQCHSEMVTSCQAQLAGDCAGLAGMGHGGDGRHRMHPMGSSADSK